MIVQDEETRKALVSATWGQKQVIEGSHVFVFCSLKGDLEAHIDSFTKLKAKALDKEENGLKGYAEFIKNKLKDVPKGEQGHWMAKQNYIALGQLLTACSIMRIDACPIEGFVPDDYDRILGLSELGLHADVVVVIGYRASDDAAQRNPKVRKASEELFLEV